MSVYLPYKCISGLLLILLLFSSCKEKYYPEIENTEPLLIVEALITNEPAEHYVYLSRSWNFDQSPQWIAESHSTVWLTSGEGDSIPLTERDPGRYYTTADFFAREHTYYVLNIITLNGDFFQSKPQKLPGEVMLDTVYAQDDTMLIMYDIGGATQIRDIPVISLMGDFSPGNNQSARVRFETELMLTWVIRVGPPDLVERYYHWLSLDISKYLPNRTSLLDANIAAAIEQQFAFFPFERARLSILGFPDGIEYLPARFLRTSFYSLNDDAWLFHMQKDKQISSEGQLFDPMEVDVEGNIFSVSGHEKVLGFFEVSNINRHTYRVQIPSSANPVSHIEEIDDLSDLPVAGYYFNEIPPFWQF